VFIGFDPSSETEKPKFDQIVFAIAVKTFHPETFKSSAKKNWNEVNDGFVFLCIQQVMGLA